MKPSSFFDEVKYMETMRKINEAYHKKALRYKNLGCYYKSIHINAMEQNLNLVFASFLQNLITNVYNRHFCDIIR